MRKELCEVGQDLWENYRSASDFASEEDLYKSYVSHIKSCPECVQKLGLTKEDIEILNEDDLEPIDTKKFETISDVDLVEEIKCRGIKIEIPGNNNASGFSVCDRPHCYACDTICTSITKIKIGGIMFDIEEDTKR